MSFGAKASSSSSSTNATQTVTPTNPAWVTSGLGGMGSMLTGLGSANPSSFVAGPSALQTQAAGNASTLGGNNPAALAAFDNTTNAGIQGTSNVMQQNVAPQVDPWMIAQTTRVSQNMPTYMNSNLGSVVNPTLAAFDYGAGQNTAAEALSQAGTDSAFGGSGGALAAAATASQNNLARGQLAGSLYSNAYDTAGQLASTDANNIEQTRLENATNQEQAANENAQLQEQDKGLQLQAAGQLGSQATGLLGGYLGTDAQNASNATTQAGIGGQLQGIAQTQAEAPLSLAGDLTQMWGGLPLNLLHGQTGTMNSKTNGSSISGGASFSIPGFGGNS